LTSQAATYLSHFLLREKERRLDNPLKKGKEELVEWRFYFKVVNQYFETVVNFE
jgi:hypothetical protein